MITASSEIHDSINYYASLYVVDPKKLAGVVETIFKMNMSDKFDPTIPRA